MFENDTDYTIPYCKVVGETLPEAWEKALVACLSNHGRYRTQYDLEDEEFSKDISLMMVVKKPFSEPRIHKAIPCGIDDLEIYRQEVVDGIKDSWIDPGSGKWQYTYHQRIHNYTVPQRGAHRNGIEFDADLVIDQMAYVIETLAKTPHSRRAQINIWKVWEDIEEEYPACLQNLWFRINTNDELVLHAFMRSNDAFKACFMNMYAFTSLQEKVAKKLSERLDKVIKVGYYCHIVNSFHVYGKDLTAAYGLWEKIKSEPIEKRIFNTSSVADIIREAHDKAREIIRRS